ncbi:MULTISPECIES: SDR family oxidoreductase [Acidiplasma]|uniref:3-ketoacyl-ACP reductase n=2 Tax=Acidiplasma TaxID=507753 RepID=A0A0Q0RSF9_9ARCH|nr:MULTISPECIES: SDR family oxidoreductase [Acidiplasma]KJE49070.1 3-ketoacyl-ACP reductase [Acidiplasma sp. MBA-1]KPV47265.1 3-ketoacyl-ACP reductase [Acidiplasma aeolicum]KQB34431.1 3-ketoacyl-ACP reductase [Acidiplasma aeolicum]KQB35283.1 3-ketoacyl-ACP reductase [Acidiplasma cupricumulans]WMT54224.1 MAG: SDR family oxidoreductase [Acidiplasma sp.]
MNLLKDKIVLITGASKGLGRAIAEKFSAEGARIAINYNHDARSAELLREKLPGSEIFQADVSSHDSVKNMIEEIHKKMGTIDILVNNAGMWHLLSWDDFDDAKVNEMISVNLMGQIYAAKECLEDIKKNKGIIINMASNAGVGTAASNTTFYSISKAGVIMLTKRLAFDLSGTGVRVNAIAPGWIETDMTIGGKTSEEIKNLEHSFISRTSLKMFGKPEYIADAALFLATDASKYMNGQVLVVDGGRIDNLTHSL